MVFYDTIKIWNLNDLKLIKESEDSETYNYLLFYSSSIDADSKKLAN